MAVESEFVWHSNRGSAPAYADPPDRGRTVNVDKEGDAGPELLGRESMLARLLLLPLLLAGPTASRLSRGDGTLVRGGGRVGTVGDKTDGEDGQLAAVGSAALAPNKSGDAHSSLRTDGDPCEHIAGRLCSLPGHEPAMALLAGKLEPTCWGDSCAAARSPCKSMRFSDVRVETEGSEARAT